MRRKTARKRPTPKRSAKPVADADIPEAPQVEASAEPSERTTCPIVGIGASAGGLEAFSQLLKALPSDTGMSFVLVQHLDPTHESQLPEILSRTTAMPVVAVTNGLRVERNRVYVIPPNTDLTVSHGVFALTPRIAADRHTPIDHFFRSLAETLEGRAIGVVLSGTGTDGLLGLRAIKAEGGLTFVQDEKSAKHAGMPHSAAPVADFVLPPQGIARELTRIGRHAYVNEMSPLPAAGGAPVEEADVRGVLRVLRTATGVDFAQYKPASVRRRIARRMLLARIDDLEGYVQHLRQMPQEAQALRDDILIQVTGFFREPDGFEALRRSVFPSLVKERDDDGPIRIWVPGCASGEEAYSLVVCLLEYLGEHDSDRPIQMFATDLSASAIAQARTGVFPASIEHEVSPDRLRRFFAKADGRYQISKAIRDACVFAPQDVTRDPPFSKLDLISCCNVLIYLNSTLQERVLPVFHYALKPRGFLKLGPAEGIGRFTNLFSVVDKKHRIYARKAGPSAHLGFGLTANDRIAVTADAKEPEAGWSTAAIEKEADRLVLGRYGPAGVVVNADMQIVQFRGKTGAYLEATPGAASLNLFKMAREGLASPLREAIQQVAKRAASVKMDGLRIKVSGGIREVGLEVIPLGSADGVKGRHYVILFSEARRRSAHGLPPRAEERAPRAKTSRERRVTRLAQELADAHRELQSSTEEHEAAAEELRAATEEAQSSNEELQSTNEELETAKEELQATNEELTTVNDELNSRNAELGQLSNDLANVLTSTHVPIIMVGPDLRIRRMTPVTERVLNVAPADIGRPIGDLRLSVEVPELEAMLREAIETLLVQEREVVARDGHWYSVRVRPYRTTDNRIDGAVVSFVDIDALKHGFELTQRAREQAEAIVATVREPLVILDEEFRVVIANRSFYETFQVPRSETEGRSLFELGNRQWDIRRLRAQLERVLPRDSVFEDFEVEHDFETIGRRTMLLNARRMLQTSGEPALILLAIEDVTERKRLESEVAALLTREQAVRMEAQAANSAKDRFVAVLSHELRTPLTAMLGWIRMLRTQNLDKASTTKALEVIERNTVLQARLIEDLLDVSLMVAGNLRLDTRPIVVAPVVEAALAAMQPVAKAKAIHLDSSIDQTAFPVRGDPTRLQQVVWNLVANAIKFTPSGGRVDVGLARRGSAVEIRVRDTGQGITAEQIPGLFNRFGDGHGSTSQGGLGLGLAIVRHLVGLHGGNVHAASDGVGRGATFTVTLPLTEERPSDQREAGGAAGRQGLAVLAGVRVLVVEDEADAQDLLRAVLERCGAEVTVAATASAALSALQREPFDVLVSDIGLPGDDGYVLIRRVRALDAARGGRIPALALTAYARLEDRDAAMAAGYQQHAAKPIDPAEFAAAVADLAGLVDRQRGDRVQ